MAILKCAGEGCAYNINAAKCKGIQCNYCKAWLCGDCSKLPEKLFDIYTTLVKQKEDVSSMVFLCSTCQITAMGLNKINSNIDKIATKVDKLMTDNNDQANEIKTHINNKMTDSLNDLKKELNKSYAAVTKINIPTIKQISTNVEKVIKETSIVSKDQEQRDRSFIIYNHPEDESQTKDNQFVENFITEGLGIAPLNVESVLRLGKRGNKARPIKVKCAQRGDQVTVMRNLSNLKQADQMYKQCNISIDRNQKQREVLKALVEEAKERSSKSTEKFFIVRGSQYKPEIIEIQKRH